MTSPNLSKYFLPYQVAWLLDESPFKIWEKTRRGGMTYVQSYEDVRDAVLGRWDVWFSSADETAAKEYILYCEKWAKLFNMAAKPFNEIVFDNTGKPVSVTSVRFANGRRITALTSSPSQFRSKGGKVVLDEFAWHKDQDGMWAAAEPTTTWGFPLRIISTHNGQGCKFFKFIKDKENNGAVVHKTTIYEAVEQGLIDKIYGRKTTDKERATWLANKRRRVGSTVWDQEYCCIAIDESTAFLSYTMIDTCSESDILRELEQIQNYFALGMDIGRKRNLTVIWIAEIIERRKYTRIVHPMEKTKFRTQYKTLEIYLKHQLLHRANIDARGIGAQIAEDAQDDYGTYRVEAIEHTNKNKMLMGEALKTQMEDREFLIPKEGKLGDTIREDFHSVIQEVTPAGNTRFAVGANDEAINSHADYFIAAMLANNAAGTASLGKPQVTTLTEQMQRKITAQHPGRIQQLLSGFKRQ